VFRKKFVNSPTFTIINEYTVHEANLIYHFDFYRIKKVEELIDIGIEEYLYSDNYCFIEWPEIVGHMLPVDFVKVFLKRK